MRRKYFTLSALFGLTMLLSSCNNALEENLLSSAEKNTESITTRSLMTDSLNAEIPTPLEETEEMKTLKEKLKETMNQRAATLAYDDYDENFSSNMYAIRELPVTIYARGVVGNTSYRYWSCEGAGKEVVLANSVTSNKQKFYLKILPATSGIPYLIYSYTSNTPLAVGQYNSNPNNKIIFAQPNNSGSTYSASWDLKPSQTNKGYFAIESQSYLGQSDPNNMWSVFNYAAEVKNDNKIGYGQYSKKAQQEFLIKPTYNLNLLSIKFDEKSAKCDKGREVEIKGDTKNTSVEPKPYTIPINEHRNETSYFSEKQGNIQFDFSDPTKPFQRPTVTAGQIILPKKETPHDAPYKTTGTYNISKKLSFNIEGDAPANCLIKVTAFIKTYNVSIDYTATALCGDRIIKLSGTWRGYVIADPKDAKPEYAPKFWDLDTNEEIIPLRQATSRITFND